MTWNKRLAQERKAKGLGKSELARKIGVSGATLTNWENGKVASIKGENLIKVCSALGISESWLMTGREDGSSSPGQMSRDSAPLGSTNSGLARQDTPKETPGPAADSARGDESAPEPRHAGWSELTRVDEREHRLLALFRQASERGKEAMEFSIQAVIYRDRNAQLEQEPPARDVAFDLGKQQDAPQKQSGTP